MMCPDGRMEIVLMLLEDYGPMTQKDLVLELGTLAGIRTEVAQCNVSGALFALMSWGFAEWTGQYEDRSKVFRLIEEGTVQ